MRKRLKISFTVTLPGNLKLPDLLRDFMKIKLINRKSLTHEMKYKSDTNLDILGIKGVNFFYIPFC